MLANKFVLASVCVCVRALHQENVSRETATVVEQASPCAHESAQDKGEGRSVIQMQNHTKLMDIPIHRESLLTRKIKPP